MSDQGRRGKDGRSWRVIREETEDQTLHPAAVRSARSAGRQRPEPACPVRTDFQRDRDRVLHSKSFRRLARKTQVFLNPQGDHYRTRITHTLEVAQIARTIARGLRLNEDLTEAAALGHDLGHTPFGHAGEAVLNRLAPGGFHHAKQSLRVVEELERRGRGLNLTFEVRDAIVHHSKGKGPIMAPMAPDGPATIEGQVVRLADIVAYTNHDLDDAVRANILHLSDLPKGIVETLGTEHSARITFLILDVLEHSNLDEQPRLQISNEALEVLSLLRAFLFERLYENPVVYGQFGKATKIIEDLWERFVADPDLLFDRYWSDCPEHLRTPTEQAVTDFLAGMTDRYAIRLFEELYLPRSWWVL